MKLIFRISDEDTGREILSVDGDGVVKLGPALSAKELRALDNPNYGNGIQGPFEGFNNADLTKLLIVLLSEVAKLKKASRG